MFLQSIQIENFRGIRKTSLLLDPTTIFIGENDCGKSSVLEALSIALGIDGEENPPSFTPYHFYRETKEGFRAAGPVRIRLVFQERESGEWKPIAAGPLGGLITARDEPNRSLVFTIGAEASDDESDVTGSWWFESDRGEILHRDDERLLVAIRRLNPLIWLPGGVMSRRDVSPPPPENHVPPGPGVDETEHLIQLVETHYQKVLEGTSFDLIGDLQSGFEAARDLLQRRRKRHPANHQRSLIEDIADHFFGGPEPGKNRRLRLHGSAAQRIGVLLITGAILRAGERGVDANAEPIVVIEDPETHLHPMTRASVWNVLENIRWQKVMTTHSGNLLSEAPLRAIRRLTRNDGIVREWRVPEARLSRDEHRKFNYHVRYRHDVAIFARCWLLVEGETEFWVFPELGRLCGYDFAVEGVECLEFAQSGAVPLVKVAEELGIQWHLLTDGDAAGRSYVKTIQSYVPSKQRSSRLTILRERDMEHCFWKYGYADIYRLHSDLPEKAQRRMPVRRVIEKAIERTSKPFLAIEVLEAIADRDGPGIPRPLRRVVETSIRLARSAPGSRHSPSANRGSGKP